MQCVDINDLQLPK